MALPPQDTKEYAEKLACVHAIREQIREKLFDAQESLEEVRTWTDIGAINAQIDFLGKLGCEIITLRDAMKAISS